MAKKPTAKGPTGKPVTVRPTIKAPARPAPAPTRPAPQGAAKRPVGRPAGSGTAQPAQRQPLQRGAAQAPVRQTLQRPAAAQQPLPLAEEEGMPADRFPEDDQGAAQLAAEAEIPAQLKRPAPGPLPGRGAPARTASVPQPQRIVPAAGGNRALVPRGNGGMVTFDDPNETGFENMDAQDLLIPRLTILQDLSPQVKANRSEYIEGAVPGMIYDTATGVLFGPWNTDDEWNNNPPAIVIPAYYERRGLEWLPDRGGLVRDWGTDESYKQTCEKDGMSWITPEGNRIQPTLTFYCINISENGLQCFVPMSSVFAKHGRHWNSVMSSYRVPETLAQGKLWSRGWQLRTIPQQNEQGDWMGWQIDPDLSFEEYEADIQSRVASFRNTLKAGAMVGTSQLVEDYQDSQGVADNAGASSGQM